MKTMAETRPQAFYGVKIDVKDYAAKLRDNPSCMEMLKKRIIFADLRWPRRYPRAYPPSDEDIVLTLINFVWELTGIDTYQSPIIGTFYLGKGIEHLGDNQTKSHFIEEIVKGLLIFDIHEQPQLYIENLF